MWHIVCTFWSSYCKTPRLQQVHMNMDFLVKLSGYQFVEAPVWTVTHPSNDALDLEHSASLGPWGYRLHRHLKVPITVELGHLNNVCCLKDTMAYVRVEHILQNKWKVAQPLTQFARCIILCLFIRVLCSFLNYLGVKWGSIIDTRLCFSIFDHFEY